MKASERAPYLVALAEARRVLEEESPDGWPYATTSLCGICRYADWRSGDVVCRHPVGNNPLLEDLVNDVRSGEGGSRDCFLFLPRRALKPEGVVSDARVREELLRDDLGA